ncbi:MAG TPA: heme NO-binding domain-containing protein [Ilumatobacter sp.]|nr:heme NO-binding domain-containing protein [Ilumatobacter sp.]
MNQGLQDFVSSVGGDALWRAVRSAAGVETEVFVSMNSYPDAVTLELVGAASRVLDMPTEEILRAFGKHWILYTARRGYGAIFDTMGRTLPEFLANLDMMHTRLSLSMPELRPPAFVCEPLEDGRIRIEYRSGRDGLAPMVVGLLEGLAEMYGLEMAVRHTVERHPGHDHDEFVLEPTPTRSGVLSV